MLLSGLLLGIVVIFNPIIPVYLYKKSLWVPIDIISAIIFSVSALNVNKKMFKKKRIFSKYE